MSLLPEIAHAQESADYGPSTESWNGLGSFVALASEHNGNVMQPAEIDVDQLNPDDALAIFYPSGELPSDAIHRFLEHGGRLLLADDYGDGTSVLDVYNIQRHPLSAGDHERVAGNRNLLIARASGDHPLTEGVELIVTNHASSVSRPGLEPVFIFPNGQAALVLVGAVGKGRLVALSDPSVLINNMLEFRQNRIFARNLVKYLVASGTGRLFIATPTTAWKGIDSKEGRSLSAIDERLAEVETEGLPEPLLKYGLLGGLVILLAAAFSSIPRQNFYTIHMIASGVMRAAIPTPEVRQSNAAYFDAIVALRDELRSAAKKKKRPSLEEAERELDAWVGKRASQGAPFVSSAEFLRIARTVKKALERDAS